jgi:hypothetical protein
MRTLVRGYRGSSVLAESMRRIPCSYLRLWPIKLQKYCYSLITRSVYQILAGNTEDVSS